MVTDRTLEILYDLFLVEIQDKTTKYLLKKFAIEPILFHQSNALVERKDFVVAKFTKDDVKNKIYELVDKSIKCYEECNLIKMYIDKHNIEVKSSDFLDEICRSILDNLSELNAKKCRWIFQDLIENTNNFIAARFYYVEEGENIMIICSLIFE